ncbi:MAG: DUF748 domain-containing protein [Deltaproteobacteria bacterium]|nr:DUF748 domain-containing protein [Deltaproteobacteria bacterium]
MALTIFREKKFFLLLITGLILLFFGLPWGLRFILPANMIRTRVERELGKELQAKTIIEEVRFGLLPAPSIRLIGLHLLDRKTNMEWLRSDSLEARLKLLPLLRGKVVPGKLLLKHPRFRLERGKNGSRHFPGSPFSAFRRNASPRLSLPSHLPIDSLILEKASLEIPDRLHPGSPSPVKLRDMDISLRGLSGNTPIFFKIRGEFPHGRFESRPFSAEGQVDRTSGKIDLHRPVLAVAFSARGIPPAMIRPYLKEKLQLDLLSGTVNLKGHLARNREGVLTLSGDISLKRFRLHLPAYASHPVTGEKASLSFMLQRDRGLIAARSLEMTVDGLTFWGHGTYRTEAADFPGFSLFLHAAGLPPARLKQYAPDKILPKEFTRSFLPGKTTGTLDIPLLEITRNTKEKTAKPEPENTRVRLKIAFHDFGAFPGEGLLPLEKVNGNLTWAGGSLRFDHLRGLYGRSLFRNLTGTLAFTNPSDTDLRINGRLNLEEAAQLLLRLPEENRGKLFPAQIPKMEGYANLNIRLQRTDHSPPPLKLTGTVNLIHAGFNLPAAPVFLSGLEGPITFASGRITPFQLKAEINTLPVTLTGKIDRLFEKGPILNLRVDSRPTAEELIRFLPFLKDRFTFTEGVPDLTLKIEGPPEDLQFQGRFDLTRPAVMIPNRLQKKEGTPLLLDFSGSHGREKESVLKTARLTLGNETLVFSGTITDPPDPRLTFAVKVPSLSLKPLAGMIPALAPQTTDGSLHGKLEGSYRFGRPGSSQLNGQIMLRDVTLRLPHTPDPLRGLSGTLLFSGQRVTAKGFHCRWDGIPITFDMNLPHRKAPRPEFHIHVPSVNLLQRIKTLGQNRPEESKKPEDSFRKLDFRATIHFNHVRAGLLKLEDFRAKLHLKEGHLSIPVFTARGLDGSVKGKGMIDFTNGKEPEFRGKVNIQGVSAEKYLQLLPHNRAFYTGEISGSIGVTGKIYPNLEKTAREMTGTAHLKIKATKERNVLFQITRDIIQRMEIMLGRKNEKFLIVEHDGMRGDFTLSDGKFHSSNFSIRGYHKFDVSGLTLDRLTAAIPIRIKYDIRATGSFDFLNHGIDCYIAAEPFSIATKLVRKVPLAGRVLTGKNKSLYTAYFRFFGSLNYKDRGTRKGAKLKKLDFRDLSKKVRKALTPPG